VHIVLQLDRVQKNAPLGPPRNIPIHETRERAEPGVRSPCSLAFSTHIQKSQNQRFLLRTSPTPSKPFFLPSTRTHRRAQAAEIALFTPLSSNVDATVCLPEGPSAPSLDYCVPSSSVAKVNLPKSSTLGVVTQEKADLSFLSQQLCILDSNSAELGRYFADPGQASVAHLAAARTREIGKFWTADPNAAAAAAAAAVSASSQYRVNDTIAATGAPGNVFTLPGATFSGVCGYTNVVGFGLPLPEALDSDASSCVVPLDDDASATGALAAACTASTLNAANLVTNLRLATTKASEPAYVAPTVSSMVYRSAVGGLEAAVAGTAAPAATYDATTGVCTFAVAEAHFTLTHDGGGSLTAAAVALVFADAVHPGGAAAAATAAGAAAPAAAAKSLRQKFSVSFLKTGETAVRMSGAPGYEVGAPLLAGVSLADPTAGSTKTAVSRLVGGLPVPAAGSDGRCGVNNKSPVLFGMSQSSSCAVPLTLSGLQAFCEGTGATGTIDAFMYALGVVPATATPDNAAPSAGAPLPAQLMDGLLFTPATAGLTHAAATTVVAGWADASFLNLADWTSCSSTDSTDCATEAAALAAPTAGMTWTAATRTCSNVPVGIELDVLTAKVGTMDNPQSRVARVATSWRYASWTYAADPFAAAATRQDFMLESAARFVEMVQDSAEGVTPQSPPVFPSLPSDFFYPFLSAAPAGGRAAASAAWWVALAAAFVVACVTDRGADAF
jgi:tectonic-1/3